MPVEVRLLSLSLSLSLPGQEKQGTPHFPARGRAPAGPSGVLEFPQVALSLSLSLSLALCCCIQMVRLHEAAQQPPEYISVRHKACISRESHYKLPCGLKMLHARRCASTTDPSPGASDFDTHTRTQQARPVTCLHVYINPTLIYRCG